MTATSEKTTKHELIDVDLARQKPPTSVVELATELSFNWAKTAAEIYARTGRMVTPASIRTWVEATQALEAKAS